mmetsp:Transcript_6734/g.17352  ORF Transcript_6734/g.17352 Transcript_6734/m.17352 type:complete len:234 (+) Transcript_6734:140-841(+)
MHPLSTRLRPRRPRPPRPQPRGLPELPRRPRPPLHRPPERPPPRRPPQVASVRLTLVLPRAPMRRLKRLRPQSAFFWPSSLPTPSSFSTQTRSNLAPTGRCHERAPLCRTMPTLPTSRRVGATLQGGDSRRRQAISERHPSSPVTSHTVFWPFGAAVVAHARTALCTDRPRNWMRRLSAARAACLRRCEPFGSAASKGRGTGSGGPGMVQSTIHLLLDNLHLDHPSFSSHFSV